MAFTDERVCCFRELCDLLRREHVRPSLRVRRVLVGFPDRRAGDALGERAVRVELVVEWWVLARRFEAVGKHREVDGFLAFDPRWVGRGSG